MNTSKELPSRTQKTCSESHKKALTFAYRVGNGVYINLTNRCTNDCVFCLRRNDDRAYNSDVLWLEREPTAREAFEAAKALAAENTEEFVFCGYGEPICRADALIETAKMLRSAFPLIPIRVNTNGQADLICKRDIVPELAQTVNAVSISLNTPNAREYLRICRPAFGIDAFDAMIDFASRCAKAIPNVAMSVVKQTLTESELDECRRITDGIGVTLRVREYISENDQNG